jgi:hypothetical protein
MKKFYTEVGQVFLEKGLKPWLSTKYEVPSTK